VARCAYARSSGLGWAKHNFKGEKHRVLLVPDTSGGLELAVGGLGKRQGGLSMWHAAGFAERLPPRRFRFAQRMERLGRDAALLGVRLRLLSLRAVSSEQVGIDPPPSKPARMRITVS